MARPLRPRAVFANAATGIEPFGPDYEPGDRVECIANAAPAVIGADGWMRLAAYGDHPYGKEDVQAFDRPAAEDMARRFAASANSALRRLFTGPAQRPVYYGHPDHPSFAVQGHDDYTLQATITQMEARDDGLYIRPEFTDHGNALLAAGEKLFWSPRWISEMIRKDNGRRVWRPYKLLSAGLTPTPNIYGSAANAQPEPEPENEYMKDLLKKLMLKIGYSEEEADALLNEAESAPKPEAVEKKVEETVAQANAHAKLTGSLRTLLGLAADAPVDVEGIRTRLAAADQANAALATAQTAFANERQARATLIVERALEDGRLTAADRDAKIGELAKAENFGDQANALLTAAKVMPSGGKANGLGTRKGEMQDQANARAVVDQFNAELADFANAQGIDLDRDYQKAHSRFKATAKGAELTAAMGRKAGE